MDGSFLNDFNLILALHLLSSALSVINLHLISWMTHVPLITPYCENLYRQEQVKLIWTTCEGYLGAQEVANNRFRMPLKTVAGRMLTWQNEMVYLLSSPHWLAMRAKFSRRSKKNGCFLRPYLCSHFSSHEGVLSNRDLRKLLKSSLILIYLQDTKPTESNQAEI